MSSDVVDYKSPDTGSPADRLPPMVPILGEIKPITSLRFAAALFIMLGHSGGLFGLPAFLWQSTQSVAFFFVLSGFVMANTYPTLEGVGVFRFYLRRFARLWPLYIFALLVALAIDPEASLAGEAIRKWQILLNVLMMQVWVIFQSGRGGAGYAGLNLCIHTASWTISTLWMLYLLFPFLIGKPSRGLRPIAIFLALIPAVAMAILPVAPNLLERIAQAGLNLSPSILPAATIAVRVLIGGLFLAISLGLLWPGDFRERWRSKFFSAIALVLTIITLSKYTFLGQLNVQRESAIPVNNLIYWHFSTRIFEFMFGMVAAVWFQRIYARWQPKLLVATLLEILAIAAVWGSVFASKYECGLAVFFPKYLGSDWATWLGMGGLTTISFAFTLIVFAFNRGLFAKILSMQLPVLLGTISYAFFLIHPIYIHYIRSRKLALPALPDWVMISFVLIVTIYSAHLMWLLIERPARRLLRGEWNLPKLGGGEELTPVRAAARVAEVAALAILLGVGIWMAHYQPNIDIAGEEDLKNFLSVVRPETRNAKFGDNMVMLGARTSPTQTGGLQIRIAWRSEAHQGLNYTVALQLIENRDSPPYANADYKQDAQSIVERGMEWRDVAITIPAAKLENAYALAIGLKGPDGELLPVKGYPTDWNDKRLLILLK